MQINFVVKQRITNKLLFIIYYFICQFLNPFIITIMFIVLDIIVFKR